MPAWMNRIELPILPGTFSTSLMLFLQNLGQDIDHGDPTTYTQTDDLIVDVLAFHVPGFKHNDHLTFKIPFRQDGLSSSFRIYKVGLRLQ